MVPKYHKRLRIYWIIGHYMSHIKFCCQFERMYAYSNKTWRRPKDTQAPWFPEDYIGQPLGSNMRKCQRILNLGTFEHEKCLIQGIGKKVFNRKDRVKWEQDWVHRMSLSRKLTQSHSSLRSESSLLISGSCDPGMVFKSLNT